MLTDEQLLSSPIVRDVLQRAGRDLHKTAGAVALGVDEVTLENAVLALCTKIAHRGMQQAQRASALDSLEKVSWAGLPAGYLGGDIGSRGASEDDRHEARVRGLMHGFWLGPTGEAVGQSAGRVTGGALGAAAARISKDPALAAQMAQQGGRLGKSFGEVAAPFGLGYALGEGYDKTASVAATLRNTFSRAPKSVASTTASSAAKTIPDAAHLVPMGRGGNAAMRITGGGADVASAIPVPAYAANAKAAPLPAWNPNARAAQAAQRPTRAGTGKAQLLPDESVLRLNSLINPADVVGPRGSAAALDHRAFGDITQAVRKPRTYGRTSVAHVLDRVFEKVALSDRGAMGLLMVAPAIAGAYGGYEGAQGHRNPDATSIGVGAGGLAGGLTGIPLALAGGGLGAAAGYGAGTLIGGSAGAAKALLAKGNVMQSMREGARAGQTFGAGIGGLSGGVSGLTDGAHFVGKHTSDVLNKALHSDPKTASLLNNVSRMALTHGAAGAGIGAVGGAIAGGEGNRLQGATMGAVTGGAIGAGAGHLAKANYGKRMAPVLESAKGLRTLEQGMLANAASPAAQHGISQRANEMVGALVDPAAAAASRRSLLTRGAGLAGAGLGGAGLVAATNPNQKNASIASQYTAPMLTGAALGGAGANLALDGDENRALGTLGGAAAGAMLGAGLRHARPDSAVLDHIGAVSAPAGLAAGVGTATAMRPNWLSNLQARHRADGAATQQREADEMRAYLSGPGAQSLTPEDLNSLRGYYGSN